MIWRSVLSIISIVVSATADIVWNAAATIGSAGLAGKQFENSDSTYVATRVGLHFYAGGWPALLLIVALFIIWWKPVMVFLKSSGGNGTAAIIFAFIVLYATQSFAYYSQTDYNESYFILPNESAFFVPDVGANKDTQAKFGSQAYYEEHKIAAKRFTIPHGKLENSGAWSNYYVPTGRLIIVDRTPYNRDWISASERGTSKKDEGFYCQSSEGINIKKVGIAIGASVSEDQAPTFLYHFGVNPPVDASGRPADRTKPEVIFTSIFWGRSLHQVMDSVVRSNISGMVCAELAAHPLDYDDAHATDLMGDIQKKVSKYMLDNGITLDYIGWADEFGFDNEVQNAINERYAAEKIEPVLSALQTKAVIDAVMKWDGKMPTTLSLWWLPSGVRDFFENIGDKLNFSKPTTQPTVPTKK